jgi:hypothetical protein
MRAEIRRRHLRFDHVVAHRRVVGRNIKASDEPGLRHPPLDLPQRPLHTAVATHMGARARNVRREALRDRLGLTLEPTTTARAPKRHLATVEIPQAAKFEGGHGGRVRPAARLRGSGRPWSGEWEARVAGPDDCNASKGKELES